MPSASLDTQSPPSTPRRVFLSWLDQWGLAPVRRNLSFATWPTTPVEHAHGPQLVPRIAEQAVDLASLLAKKRPSLVVFLSCYLWQAMNLARDAFLQTAGTPRDAGRRITDMRLAAYLQRWAALTVLALPMPSRNTTPAYVESLGPGVQEALRISGNLPSATQDPLLDKAARELVVDPKASIDRIRSRLHVDEKRAIALFSDLQGSAYEQDGKVAVFLR